MICKEGDCNLKGLDGRYSPEHYAQLGKIEILSAQIFPKEYFKRYQLACSKCGQHFEVDEDPGYHFPVTHYPYIKSE